jgi:hypothetical protein
MKKEKRTKLMKNSGKELAFNMTIVIRGGGGGFGRLNVIFSVVKDF